MRGVFFVPFEHQADREDANRRIAESLRQAGIPVVLIDRDLGAFPNRSNYDLVGIDNRRALTPRAAFDDGFDGGA